MLQNEMFRKTSCNSMQIPWSVRPGRLSHDTYARDQSPRSVKADRHTDTLKRPRYTVSVPQEPPTPPPPPACQGCHEMLNNLWSHVCDLDTDDAEFAIRLSNYKWESAESVASLCEKSIEKKAVLQ